MMMKSDGSWWRRSFADALIKLRPDMNPDAADEISDTAFDALSDLSPQPAAHAYSRWRDTTPPADWALSAPEAAEFCKGQIRSQASQDRLRLLGRQEIAAGDGDPESDVLRMSETRR